MARNITSGGMYEDAEKATARLNAKTSKIMASLAGHGYGPQDVDIIEKRLARMQGRLRKAELSGDKDRFDLIQKSFDKMTIDIMTPMSVKRFSKGMSDAAQTFGEGLQGAFQTIKSKDLGQMAGMFKKMAQSATVAGTKMEGTAVKGVAGLGIEGLGRAMSAIGPAIAAIAGAVMGIAALIKIVMDADSRIKDMNKAMIAAGIAGQEFGENVGDGMDRMRAAFTGWDAIGYLDELGIKSEEATAAIGGFQKAGLTFKELGGNAATSAEAVANLRESVKSVVVYSKLLGESSDKVAGDMAKMAEETSTTLEGVRDKFGEIAAAAKQSGFDTKRFYGMVLEVTTGMSMYNVRLQDTIGLLTMAGKVLGPDAGKAWAQSLAGTGKDLSTRDAYIAQKKMGTGQVQKVSKIDAKMQAEALGRSFQDIGAKGGKGKEQMDAALKRANLSSDMSGEALADGLSKLSEEQALILRAELNRVEGVSGLGTKTAQAQYVARAGAGLGGEGAATVAMQNQGLFGGLASKVQGAHAIEGGRLDWDKMKNEDIVGKIAAEQVGGKMSTQDQDMLKDAIGALRSKGEKVNMDNIAKELGLMQAAADEGQKKIEDEKKLKENAWQRDQELAQQVVANTQSIADRMDNVMEQLLTEIAEGVGAIVAWLPGEGDKRSKLDARRVAGDSVKSEIAKLQEELKNTDDSGDKDEIKKQIAYKKATLQNIRGASLDGDGDFARAGALKALPEADRKEMERRKAEVNKTRQDSLSDESLGFGARVEVNENADKELKAIEQEFLKKQEKIDDDRTKRSDDKIVKAMKDNQQAEAIASTLVDMGVGNSAEAMELAQKLQSGAMNPESAGKHSDIIKRYIQGDRSQTTRVSDGTLTYEEGGRRQFAAIAADDVVDIHHKGKPRYGGGGGGNISISVNQWGDVPGAVLKALETMRVRT